MWHLRRSVLFLLPLAAILALATDAVAAGMLLPKDGSRPIEVKSHRVSAVVEDGLARTTLRQTFVNPHRQPLEAIYVFPVPKGAVMTDVAMVVNGMRLEGLLVERQRARNIYTDIVSSRKDPALIEKIGPEMFRLSVFPVMPGKDTLVELTWIEQVPLKNGVCRYVYPLALAQESVRTKQDFSFTLTMNSSVPFASVTSPVEDMKVETVAPGERVASFVRNGAALDEDIVVEALIDVPEPTVRVNTFRRGEEDGWFQLVLTPPKALPKDRIPRDVIVVVDTSNSMRGQKIEQARRTALYVIDHLFPGDRVNVIQFGTGQVAFADLPVEPTKENLKKLREFVAGFEARGATSLESALKVAVKVPVDKNRTPTLILVTDGIPTKGEADPAKIVDLAKQGGDRGLRLFAFGLGDDVNPALLEGVSEASRGHATVLKPGEADESSFAQFLDRVASPAISDIRLTVDGTDIYDIYPRSIPDVYVGEQLVLTGRYRDGGKHMVKVTASVGGKEVELEREVEFRDELGGSQTAMQFFAQQKIGALQSRHRLSLGLSDEAFFKVLERGEYSALEPTIAAMVSASLTHGVQCAYTSFLVLLPEDRHRVDPKDEGAVAKAILKAAQAGSGNVVPEKEAGESPASPALDEPDKKEAAPSDAPPPGVDVESINDPRTKPAPEPEPEPDSRRNSRPSGGSSGSSGDSGGGSGGGGDSEGEGSGGQGGKYRGPAGSDVPPGERDPKDSPPPAEGDRQPAGEAAPGSEEPAPGDSGASAPPPSSGGAAAPTLGAATGARPGRRTAAKKTAEECWIFWWEHNREAILKDRWEELDRAKIYASPTRGVTALRVAATNIRLDRNIRAEAIVSLARAGGGDEAGLIRALIAREPKKLGTAGVVALGLIREQDPETRALLLHVAGDSRAELATRCAAILSLGHAGYDDEDVILQLKLWSATNANKPDIAAAALLALGLAGDVESVPELEQWLVEGRIGNRKLSGVEMAWIAEALGRIGDPRATKVLLAMLTGKDRDAKRSAATALGRVLTNAEPSERARWAEALTRFGRREKDLGARNFTALALGRIAASPGTSAGLEKAIVRYLMHEFESANKSTERPYAALALGMAASHVEPETRKTILRAIRGELVKPRGDKVALGALALALGIAWDDRPETGRVLARILDDQGQDVRLRSAAAAALGMIGDRRYAGAVLSALEGAKDRSLRLEAATAAALLGDRRAAKGLVATLTEGEASGFDLGSAALAIGRLGDPDALSPLIALLEPGKVDGRYPDQARALAAEAIGALLDRMTGDVFWRLSEDLNYRALSPAVSRILIDF